MDSDIERGLHKEENVEVWNGLQKVSTEITGVPIGANDQDKIEQKSTQNTMELTNSRRQVQENTAVRKPVHTVLGSDTDLDTTASKTEQETGSGTEKDTSLQSTELGEDTGEMQESPNKEKPEISYTEQGMETGQGANVNPELGSEDRPVTISEKQPIEQKPGFSDGLKDPVAVGTETLPVGWSLQKLGLELPLAESETIVCISPYEANLYIGTSKGQLLHLYLFDDADQYMLILQVSVAEEKVVKILPVPDVAMCLVLAGKSVHSYSLPELTPCRIGKIKDAEDMLLLSVGKVATAKNKNKSISLSKNDKVIVYTAVKLRVVQLFPTGLKLLRDINYVGAKRGLSSATGTLANYSNICLVANDQRYDVVDMQQARKIPLFDYNPVSAPRVTPYMVPYLAHDLSVPREEYVLAVCTDSTLSMAMFINSDGDVTRGTLPWMDNGYPHTGIAVDWPYVVGCFLHSPNLAQKIVFSSLESLETVCTLEPSAVCGGSDFSPGCLAIVNSGNEIKVADLALLCLRAPVSCVSRQQTSPQKQLTVSKTVFSDGRRLFCLQKTSELENELQGLLKGLETPATTADAITRSINFFSKCPASDVFLYSVFLVLLLLKGKFLQLQKTISENHLGECRIDPRLFMLFCAGSSSEAQGLFWDDFQTEAVFLDIRDRILDIQIKQNRAFYKWLIREIYNQGEIYDDVIRAGIRKLVYTETCENVTAVLAMVDSETTLWLGQNAINDSLMTHFENGKMFLVLLHIYTIKQTAGNVFEQWPLKIIDLSLDLLSGTKTDPSMENTQQDDIIPVGTYKFNLPKIAFNELRENVEDETLYTKKLLRLLQLRPDNGLALLKSARGNKFASTHRFILEELSKSYKFDSKFSLLKIEYTEQSFLDKSKAKSEVDFATGSELLADYLDYLNQEDLQVEYENLTILYNTYLVENDLKDPLWPKVTWIDYLRLNYRKGECEEFLKVYLKVYEMMVLNAMYQRNSKPQLKSDKEAVLFLHWVFDESSHRETQLRKMKDHSTAEWLVFYVHPPVPRSSFLLKELQIQNLLELRKRPVEKVTSGLKSLILYYLALPDIAARNSSVMHAVNVYGNQHLSIDEVLQILPEDFPLMYVEKYMEAQVLQLECRRSDVQLQKALSKASGKLNKTVLREFETTKKQLESLVNTQ